MTQKKTSRKTNTTSEKRISYKVSEFAKRTLDEIEKFACYRGISHLPNRCIAIAQKQDGGLTRGAWIEIALAFLFEKAFSKPIDKERTIDDEIDDLLVTYAISSLDDLSDMIDVADVDRLLSPVYEAAGLDRNRYRTAIGRLQKRGLVEELFNEDGKLVIVSKLQKKQEQNSLIRREIEELLKDGAFLREPALVNIMMDKFPGVPPDAIRSRARELVMEGRIAGMFCEGENAYWSYGLTLKSDRDLLACLDLEMKNGSGVTTANMIADMAGAPRGWVQIQLEEMVRNKILYAYPYGTDPNNLLTVYRRSHNGRDPIECQICDNAWQPGGISLAEIQGFMATKLKLLNTNGTAKSVVEKLETRGILVRITDHHLCEPRWMLHSEHIIQKCREETGGKKTSSDDMEDR